MCVYKIRINGYRPLVGTEPGLSKDYDTDWGISAGGLVDFARYVAVAPINVSTDLQYLDFEL